MGEGVGVGRTGAAAWGVARDRERETRAGPDRILHIPTSLSLS